MDFSTDDMHYTETLSAVLGNSNHLGPWLATTAEEAVSKSDGLLGKQSSGDLTVFASRKKNARGNFLLLMFISPRIKTGAKFIACPVGAEGIGWLHLADSIRAVCEQASADQHPPPQPPDSGNLVVRPVQQGGGRRPRNPQHRRNRRQRGSASILVKIIRGVCIMQHIPDTIHNLIRLFAAPTISPTTDPQQFKLHLQSVSDATKLGDIASLQLKTVSFEFMKVTEVPSQEEPAWSDITTRVINLWGLPESAKTQETIAMFCTDFGLFRSMEVITNKYEKASGIRVTLDHSDLSLMPQLKYLDWEDDIHDVRIIPVRTGGVRRRDLGTDPVVDTPESSATAEKRSEAQTTPAATAPGTRDTNHNRSSTQLLLLHPTRENNTTRHPPAQTPTPSIGVPLQMPAVPTFNAPCAPNPSPPSNSPTHVPALSPSFAQVVRGPAPFHRPTPPNISSSSLDRPIISSSRIVDLNQPPVCSSPEKSPPQVEQTILEGLDRVGNILGYNDAEKQLMVNRTIQNLSQECSRIVQNRRERPSP